MNSISTQSAPRAGNETKSLRQEIIQACLWIVPALAVVIAVFLLVVQHARFSESGRKFLFSMIYSIAIGLPSAILLNWTGFRYTNRFPRLIVVINAFVLIGTATVGGLAAGLIFQVTNLMPRREFWPEFETSYPATIAITLLFGLSIASFETMRHKLQSATLKLTTQQAEQERAYKLLAEARLSSLASRIHPHFLFNTLNSIASLIPSDPQRAEDTVSRLASLLRFSLNQNQSGLAPLAQELKIVRDYLEIERTRFGQRLRYSIDAAATLDAVKVPPLALQTLVENSIKHVVAQRAEGATIQVICSAADERILLQVIDDGPGFSLDAITPEHGLGNLVSRLELLFGQRGQLSVARQGESTVVSVAFPVN